MASTELDTSTWTAVDLVSQLGPIPLDRLRTDPPPGTAGEHDVIRIHECEGRLFELAGGTLVEKTVGTYESCIAAEILRRIGNHVAQADLGIVLGADGMLRLGPGLIRIPDVSFISWSRLGGRRIPDQPIADLVPDLAVEVLSAGNTREEMDRKLAEYLQAGVRLVWYVDPRARQVRVYRQLDSARVIGDSQTLEGDDVLPGFELPLSQVWGMR